MPTAQVPIMDGSAAEVARRIEELESFGAINFKVFQVGDQHLITFDMKPKVGRPPKSETR